MVLISNADCGNTGGSYTAGCDAIACDSSGSGVELDQFQIARRSEEKAVSKNFKLFGNADAMSRSSQPE